MRLLVISLFALFLSLMLVIGGNAFLLTYLGVSLGVNGVSTSQIGIVMAFYSFGFAAGSYFCTSLVSKVGHIRTFAALTAITAIASVSYPLFDSVEYWSVLRLVGGFSAAGLYVIIESWFSAVATNSNRGTLFGFYQISAYAASSIAQFSVGYSDPKSPVPFTIACIVLLLAIIPLSLSRLQSPNIEAGPRMSWFSLYRKAPLGITSALCGGAMLGSYYALAPLYGSQTNMSVEHVSWLMTASVLVALAFAWPIGWLCDRLQRSHVMMGVVLIAAALSVVTVVITPFDFIYRIVVAALFLGLLSVVYSLAVALTNDRIDASARVAASSAVMTSYGIGSIVGPLVISYLMEIFSPNAMFISFAVILVFMALYVRYRQVKLPPIPVAAQETFVSAVPESQARPTFDPRSEYEDTHELEDLFPDGMVAAINGEKEDGEKTESDNASESDEAVKDTADAEASDLTNDNAANNDAVAPEDVTADQAESQTESVKNDSSEQENTSQTTDTKTEAPAATANPEEANNDSAESTPEKDQTAPSDAESTAGEFDEESQAETTLNEVDPWDATDLPEEPLWKPEEGEYFDEKEAHLSNADPVANPEGWENSAKEESPEASESATEAESSTIEGDNIAPAEVAQDNAAESGSDEKAQPVVANTESAVQKKER